MANFGNLSLTLAYAFAIYAIIALFVGGVNKRRELVKSGERALYVYFTMVTLSVASLLYLLVTGNFQVEYVASISNKAMPLYYKIAAADLKT